MPDIHQYFQGARSFENEFNALARGDQPFQRAGLLLSSMDRLGRLAYLLRTRYKSRELTDVEQHLATQAQLLGLYSGAATQTEVAWYVEYRALWQKHFDVFLFSMLTFIASFLIGYGGGLHHSQYFATVAGPEMVEKIVDNVAWFERLQKAPVLGAISIATNNIKVSLLCFLGGSLLGLGGWALLFYNGFLFGMTFGFCMANGFAERLGNFVSAHGPLELTVIIASAFASIVMGRAFWRWREGTLHQRIRASSLDGLRIMVGVLPWLILAGALEGLVSPFNYFETTTKIILGLVVALVFWIFTLWPLPKSQPA